MENQKQETYPSLFPPRILLMSRGLARYRLRLTEALDEAFRGEIQIIASPSPWNTGLWEVNWKELKERKGSLLFREVKGISISDLIKAMSRRVIRRSEREQLGDEELAVSTIEPDLIAIHEYAWAMIKLALYARLAGIPCLVFTELGRAETQHGIAWVTKILHSIGAWLTTAQIAHTPAAKQPLGASHRPIFYLPYAVHTGDFTEKPRLSPMDEVRILLVGQFIPRKGADLLLKALKSIRGKTMKPFRLRLVGNQDDLWIKTEVQKSGLGAVVDIVGIKQGEALIEEYHDADIFVLPSRFDTYGVVVHEAASCGLPLLISRHAGAAEALVKDGMNGWVIDPEDTDEFSRLLKALIEDPGLRERMGKCSREIASEMCISRQAKELSSWMKVMLPHRGRVDSQTKSPEGI
jgi:glycosyltransferase involved in cell wall biosynthesis